MDTRLDKILQILRLHIFTEQILAAEGSVSNELSKETVPMVYIVACGNPTSQGDMEMFKYVEEVPTSLCKPLGPGITAPDADELGQFLTMITERYHKGVFESKERRCVSCNRRARELFHSGLPMLSPGLGALPGFVPLLWDTAVPICRSGGSCDHHAKSLAHGLARSAFPGFHGGGNVCDRCGRRLGVKLCGGCKTLAYCSRECQRLSWPDHRQNCRLAQQERARYRPEENGSSATP